MYKVIYPIQTYINGLNVNDAIKNYVKMQNNYNLTKIIIQNENLYRQSFINYINKNGKKIAQINTIPLNPLYPLSYYIKDPINIEPLPDRMNIIPAINTPVMFPVINTPVLIPEINTGVMFPPYIPTNFSI